MSHITLQIDGMSCGHCVENVKTVLENLDGVTATQVEVGVATVEYDPAIASPEKMAEAVREAGYTARPAS